MSRWRSRRSRAHGRLLHEQTPRDQNADDQQHDQRGGDQAKPEGQPSCPPVHGALLAIRLLQLLIRLSAGGGGLPPPWPRPVPALTRTLPASTQWVLLHEAAPGRPRCRARGAEGVRRGGYKGAVSGDCAVGDRVRLRSAALVGVASGEAGAGGAAGASMARHPCAKGRIRLWVTSSGAMPLLISVMSVHQPVSGINSNRTTANHLNHSLF